MVCFNILAFAATLIPLIAAAPTMAPPQHVSGTVIADNYIVLLKTNVSTPAFEAHAAWASSMQAERRNSSVSAIKHLYNFGSLSGYSGSFDASVISQIKSCAEVELVEEDKIILGANLITQDPVPSWGLARLSSRTLGNGLNSYTYDSSAGAGVTAYVLDSGILTSHHEFGGRATWGFNAVGDGVNTDTRGHGTLVAGIIGGRKFGVAKRASLVAVKVLNHSGAGAISGVIAGISWTVADARSKGKSARSVANLSLGAGLSPVLNAAIDAAVRAGITFVVAAGNDGEDAAKHSPASAAAAITVGATDKTDTRAPYSNYGPLVDVWAPGTAVTSAYIGSDTTQGTSSGTSLAAPHVAGLAAYLIALEGLKGPAQVAARIKKLAVEGVVGSVGTGTTDAMAFNGVGDPHVRENTIIWA
ncbi:peptidase S8/S53 domain-containing protein [Geopyxis carbonaria]|nr:peptidase S8/S53 domain-containing protein [Geopyxis carbonaria]